MNKTEIKTIEELKLDIEHIKDDIEWARKNNPQLISGFMSSLSTKEKKLEEWRSVNHE